jgi:4-hydroxybutyrate CoA-transferase
MAELVRDGIVTGRFKTIHRGKVVGSSLAAIDREERALIDNNPVFELYEFNYVNDVRVILQHENMVAVNNALMVDLTGQVASEGVGPRVRAGVGGQASFAIGSTYSPGGRSIIVLPSTAVTPEGAGSRIVSVLPSGTSVTVTRDYVDYVVTEYGIASLRDKSYRERMGELVAIAHPDTRQKLKREVAEIYGYRC